MTSINPHAAYSQLRESITTHAFLAAIGTEIWRRGHFDAEILRSEFDAGGHDLVITVNGVTRHIQLKATNLSGKRTSWDASRRLADQPSGCVVVLHVDDQSLQVHQYGLFAGPPGCPLPDPTGARGSKSAKGGTMGQRAARSDRWEVPKGRFDLHEQVAELYDALFGPESPEAS